MHTSEIIGYGNEEFTHFAIAATVASNGADAGFGLRAAAAEYRLAFVPLVRGRYLLAVRAKAVKTPAVTRLIQALRTQPSPGLRADSQRTGQMAAGSVVGGSRTSSPGPPTQVVNAMSA